jgi:putative ABC transport system permease protein
VGSILQDARFAIRSLRRTPGFTLAAALTLALGIGANTAIFSAVRGVLLRPLAYPDSDRIAVLWLRNAAEGIERDVTSYPVFEAWRGAAAYEAMAAHAATTRTIAEGDPEVVEGALVTADFFRTLGQAPLLGRTLGEEDMVAGRHQVVVLSHGVWLRRYGGRADVLGRLIDLDGEATEIVGVMPARFVYPEPAEFWLPLSPSTPQREQLMQSAGALWLQVIGRRGPGVSAQRADEELAAIVAGLAEQYPGAESSGVFAEPLRDVIVGDVKPALWVLLGAVGLVLLIGCANVANLLLARGAARRRELSIRTALGATGGRLARQVFTESLVLAVFGGLAGVVLAVWGTGALVAMSPPDVPRLGDIRVDGAVLAFAAAAIIATGLLFGVIPALHARRVSIGAVLREGGRGAAGGGTLARWRPLLLTSEVALALMLLAGAGLLVRSFVALQAVDPGFATERVLSLRITPSAARYPTPDHVRTFQTELLEQLEGLGGVERAAGINTLLLSRLPNMGPVAIDGRDPPLPDAAVISVTDDMVTSDFFAVMEVPIVHGRAFGPEDVPGGVPVAIVNETFVRTFFPDEDPIGRRFTRGNPTNPDALWYTIVGVAADSRRAGLIAPVRPESYLSYGQTPRRSMNVLVRTAGDPSSQVPVVRALLRELDPSLPMADVRTLHHALREAVAVRRFVMQLLSVFATLALVLAGVGIYGVLSYMVGQRTRELGIRMALGADRRRVLEMVLGDSLVQVVPGIALGAVGALAAGRVLASQLFGISAADPLTFAAVTALLVVVALLATAAPAARAARVEPMVTLSQE